MKPYCEEHLNHIYNLLFCDDIELFGPMDVIGPESSDEELKVLIADPSAESRAKVLAWNVLRERGAAILSQHLYGVIVEVTMPEGLDTLAVYEDGTARYINYSGKLVIWETVTPESKKLADELFVAARSVVQNIGPWAGDRLPPPVTGNARMSFLAADGLYFGEGPFEMLGADPMGGAVIESAGRFMNVLVERTMDQSP